MTVKPMAKLTPDQAAAAAEAMLAAERAATEAALVARQRRRTEAAQVQRGALAGVVGASLGFALPWLLGLPEHVGAVLGAVAGFLIGLWWPAGRQRRPSAP